MGKAAKRRRHGRRTAAFACSPLACGVMLMLAQLAAAADTPHGEDMLDLSLDQLLQVRVTGAVVREIGLNLTPQTANPLRLTSLEIPASIEIIDNNTMRARGIKNVVEAADNLVGVISGETPNAPYSFSMRGFSRDSINMLYDGISMGTSTNNTRPQDTFNLERVEIIKGPSLLHGGEGSAAGSINLVTKQPEIGTPFYTEAVLALGDYRTSTVSAGLTGPVSSSAAYRLDFSRTGSGGWVEDTDSHSTNVVGSIRLRLLSDLELSASFNYLSDQLPAYWGTPLVPRAAALQPLDSVVQTTNGTVIDGATRFNNYNVADHLIDSQSLWTRLNLAWTPASDLRGDTTLYHFWADRHWRDAESYAYDATTGMIGRDRFLVTHDRSVSGLRSTLALNNHLGELENRSAVSAEWSRNDFARQVGFQATNPNPYVDEVNLLDPVPGSFGNVDIRNDYLNTTFSALTLENMLELARDWHLSLAGRYEQISFERLRYDFAGNLIARTSNDARYRQASYNAGLVHQLDAHVSLYAQLSAQHDPLEGDLAFVYDVHNFQPSKVRQAEAGTKASLDDGKLELAAALYDIRKTVYVQRQNLPGETDEQSSHGLELSARAIVDKRVRVGGNLAYTDSAFGHYWDPNIGAYVSGNRPANVPRFTASVWASARPFGDLPVELGGGANYVSDRYANTTNNVTLKAYTLVNLFAAYEARQYRLALNLRNALDKIYTPWSDPSYPKQISLGAPRTIELSLQAKF